MTRSRFLALAGVLLAAPFAALARALGTSPAKRGVRDDVSANLPAGCYVINKVPATSWHLNWRQEQRNGRTIWSPRLGSAAREWGPYGTEVDSWHPDDWQVYVDGSPLDWEGADDTDNTFVPRGGGSRQWAKSVRFVYTGRDPRYAAFKA